MRLVFWAVFVAEVLAAASAAYWTFTEGGAILPLCMIVDLLCAAWMLFMIREDKRMDAEDERLDAEWRAQIERWSK